MSRAFAERPGHGRRVLVAAAVVVVALAVAALAGRPPAAGTPLDPASTAPHGARALVLLLREGGADVRVTARPPGADRDTAVVLRDTFDAGRRAAIQRWVEAGGTLLVADPGSPLGRAELRLSPVQGLRRSPVEGTCPIPALAAVRRISVDSHLTFEEPSGPGAVACYRTDQGPFLVATPAGAGSVVAVGGAGAFVNARLDEGDNAVLAAALLAPSGDDRVAVLTDYADDAPPATGAEEDGGGMTALLPDRAVWAGLQLGVAFAVAALWRGRRLGRPVPDPQPVELPGSQLVVAVGEMLHRSGHRRRAAAALAERARRVVSERLGLPPATDPAALAQLAAARTGLPLPDVAAAVAPPPPRRDEDLVRLAAAVDRVVAATTNPTMEGSP